MTEKLNSLGLQRRQGPTTTTPPDIAAQKEEGSKWLWSHARLEANLSWHGWHSHPATGANIALGGQKLHLPERWKWQIKNLNISASQHAQHYGPGTSTKLLTIVNLINTNIFCNDWLKQPIDILSVQGWIISRANQATGLGQQTWRGPQAKEK